MWGNNSDKIEIELFKNIHSPSTTELKPKAFEAKIASVKAEIVGKENVDLQCHEILDEELFCESTNLTVSKSGKREKIRSLQKCLPFQEITN